MDIQTQIKEIKAGWKTSEFWLTIIAKGLGYSVGLGLIPTGSIWDQVAGFILGGLATLGYSYARGAAKK